MASARSKSLSRSLQRLIIPITTIILVDDGSTGIAPPANCRIFLYPQVRCSGHEKTWDFQGQILALQRATGEIVPSPTRIAARMKDWLLYLVNALRRASLFEGGPYLVPRRLA